MSDAIWTALIGVGGTLIGSATTLVVARMQAQYREKRDADATDSDGTLVLGELVDIRELRILRALYGEPRGRFLEGYQVSYYAPFLKKVVKRGWAKQIERRYYLTGKGAEVARTYLKQLTTWEPASQVL